MITPQLFSPHPHIRNVCHLACASCVGLSGGQTVPNMGCMAYDGTAFIEADESSFEYDQQFVAKHYLRATKQNISSCLFGIVF